VSHRLVSKEERTMSITKRATAEFVGTSWLVLGGCGSAVPAAAFPRVGIGLLGVALAFGLTLLTAGGLASNGYGEHSPGKYPLGACLVTETGRKVFLEKRGAGAAWTGSAGAALWVCYRR
jgi:glycerol uptake facilitator-like aquaporin